MADEEAEAETDEKKEAEGSEAVIDESAAKKKKIMLLGAAVGSIIILLLAVIIILLVGGEDNDLPEAPAESAAAPASKEPSDEAVNSDSLDNIDEIDDGSTVDTADSARAQQEALERNSGTGASVLKGPAIYYTIRPVFVVNFQASRKAKFLQVGVNVMARNEAVIDDVIDNLPLIKNDLIELFSSQKFEQLKTVEGKNELRARALKAVQDVLRRETGRAGVEEVLFTSFVMQ